MGHPVAHWSNWWVTSFRRWNAVHHCFLMLTLMTSKAASLLGLRITPLVIQDSLNREDQWKNVTDTETLIAVLAR